MQQVTEICQSGWKSLPRCVQPHPDVASAQRVAAVPLKLLIVKPRTLTSCPMGEARALQDFEVAVGSRNAGDAAAVPASKPGAQPPDPALRIASSNTNYYSTRLAARGEVRCGSRRGGFPA
ncbi:hypothetical protein E2C01_065434 [Portunus trituberculatus]|uniref:Uncharacterized protein n=1 Tax=Portunus trituberculatus TaxID=210409 RepID=A0A5B7HRQ9_PORTR|nr:hypothetical protein [Portunus trituberculatus]